jgi:hypothetical protein
MKSKISSIIFVLTLLFICTTVSASFARDSGSKGMTAQELAQLSVDIAEINNLMSLHAWYHAAFMNDVELEEIWSKKDDIVWAQNTGYWIGPKAIKAYYGRKVDRASTKGSFVWHTITTPVVEIARDRQTAKGVWYTPGIVGEFKGGFMWMFEKYGVDFVRENGVWKIWHMHVYTDTAWAQDGKIEAREGGPGGSGAPPSGQGDAAKSEKVGQETQGQDSQMAAPNVAPTKTPKIPYQELGPSTEIKLIPRPPVPYKTWSETWSYVDEGE